MNASIGIALRPNTIGLWVLSLLVLAGQVRPGSVWGDDVAAAIEQFVNVQPQWVVQQIFRNDSLAKPMSLKEWQHSHSERYIRRIVARISEMVELSDSERDELELSGHVDVQRFVSEGQRLESQISPDGKIPMSIYRELVGPIQTLQQKYESGLLGAGSEFQKSIQGVLGPERFAIYQQKWQERLVVKHSARVKYAVTAIESLVPLTQQQRSDLTALILRETEPEPFPRMRDHSVLMYDISCIAEEKMRPIFSAAEWPQIERTLKAHAATKIQSERRRMQSRGVPAEDLNQLQFDN